MGGAQKITRLAPRRYGVGQRGIPGREAILHEAASASALELAQSFEGHLLVIPELEVSQMRLDLWIGTVDLRTFAARRRATIPPLTAPFALRVALALRRLGGHAAATDLVALGDRRRIQRAFGELAERNFVERRGDGVVLRRSWRPATARGVGVEAKLGRWREAVRQVQMSRAYLNGAWLVFPSSYLPSFPRSQQSLRAIGLATVSENELTVIRRPRLRIGGEAPRALLEEHIYARWLQDNPGA